MEIEDLTGTAAVGSPFAQYSNQALYANLPSQLDVVSVGDLAEDRNADVVGQSIFNSSKTIPTTASLDSFILVILTILVTSMERTQSSMKMR